MNLPAKPKRNQETSRSALSSSEELRQLDLPPDAQATLVMNMVQQHSGPLPPADLLASYSVVKDDLPEQIVGWADLQIRHRTDLERVVTLGAERRMDRAQWFAATVAVTSIISASAVAIAGASWIASAFIVVAGVGGPAAAMVLAHKLGIPAAPPPEPANRGGAQAGQSRPRKKR